MCIKTRLQFEVDIVRKKRLNWCEKLQFIAREMERKWKKKKRQRDAYWPQCEINESNQCIVLTVCVCFFILSIQLICIIISVLQNSLQFCNVQCALK